ncbi:MAG: hypothetical protein ACK5V3_03655 [Bdellovibrionales bacterium]
MKGLLAVFLAVFVSGCQTGIFINESPAAMTDIRKAFVSVFGEPRAANYNGQVLRSQYHDKRNRVDSELATAKSRYFTQLSILGDRRPYKIKIEVFFEAQVAPQQYEIIGEDNEMAQKTADKIQEVLHQSLKGRNVIDDFRAF